MKKRPNDDSGSKTGLVVLLLLIAAMVGGLALYHYSTPSPFQNELFFGPMDE